MVFPLLSFTGVRFVGNRNPSHMEVHDLTARTPSCQLEEILLAGHAVRFVPDALEQAHADGYDNCAWCIGSSSR